MSETAKLTIHQQAELTNIGCEDIVEIEELTPQALRLELDKLKSDTEKDKACRAILSAAGTNTSNLMIELARNPAPAAQPAQTPQSGEQPPARPPQSPETNPETLPAPPQTLRDIMYAVKGGYLPITIADPAFLKDGKIGKLQKGAQWIYVGPSIAAAGIQSVLRSTGDGNYKKLIADEMRGVADELESLKKKSASPRKAELESAITALEGVKTKLDLTTIDGDKEALKLFDEYLKHRGILRVHALDHVSARAESARLRGELGLIDTAITTERIKIEDREKALKALVDGGHHPLIPGLAPGASLIPRAELDRTYTEAIDDITEGRKHASLSPGFVVPQITIGGTLVDASMAEMTAHHDHLISNAKTISGSTTIPGTATVPAINIHDITEAKIDRIIATLRSDPDYVNGAPAPVTTTHPTTGVITTTHSPATAEYSAIKQQISNLEAHRTTIERQITRAEGDKKTALKPYEVERERLTKAKTAEIRFRDTLKSQLERDKIAAEVEKTKKTTEYSEKSGKYKEPLAKLDAISRVTGATPADIAKRTALSADYDRTIGVASGVDSVRRTAIENPGLSRTDKQTHVDSRLGELKHEKEKVFDARGSAERMSNYESKITALQAEAAKLATDIDTAAAKSGDAETYKRKLFEEVNRINGEIEKLNVVGKKEVATWADLPKVELDKMLAGSKLGNHIFGVSKGLIKFDEAVLNQKHLAGTMRGVYGLIGLAGVGSLGVQAMTDWKSAGLDAADIGLGFIPGYDLYMAVRGKDLNGRPIEGKDLWARVGFGTLALVPGLGALARTAGVAALKGAGRAAEVVNTVRAVEQSTQVVGKIASTGYLGYTL
ncbi:hypothetical protein KBD33_00805, partial [Candidatus Gracilibacteria bacterium]|nr:hypothetical protein [Candidatus Gracilibacteria bacterium]